jgi:hypothetical protein
MSWNVKDQVIIENGVRVHIHPMPYEDRISYKLLSHVAAWIRENHGRIDPRPDPILRGCLKVLEETALAVERGEIAESVWWEEFEQRKQQIMTEEKN